MMKEINRHNPSYKIPSKVKSSKQFHLLDDNFITHALGGAVSEKGLIENHDEAHYSRGERCGIDHCVTYNQRQSTVKADPCDANTGELSLRRSGFLDVCRE